MKSVLSMVLAFFISNMAQAGVPTSTPACKGLKAAINDPVGYESLALALPPIAATAQNGPWLQIISGKVHHPSVMSDAQIQGRLADLKMLRDAYIADIENFSLPPEVSPPRILGSERKYRLAKMGRRLPGVAREEIPGLIARAEAEREALKATITESYASVRQTFWTHANAAEAEMVQLEEALAMRAGQVGAGEAAAAATTTTAAGEVASGLLTGLSRANTAAMVVAVGVAMHDYLGKRSQSYSYYESHPEEFVTKANDDILAKRCEYVERNLDWKIHFTNFEKAHRLAKEDPNLREVLSPMRQSVPKAFKSAPLSLRGFDDAVGAQESASEIVH